MKKTFPLTGHVAHVLLMFLLFSGTKTKWIMKKIYFTILLFALSPVLFGQITVTQSANSQTLSQLLAGSGVTISNYTLTCAANGSGIFNNVSSNVGMPGGVILSSGQSNQRA